MAKNVSAWFHAELHLRQVVLPLPFFLSVSIFLCFRVPVWLAVCSTQLSVCLPVCLSQSSALFARQEMVPLSYTTCQDKKNSFSALLTVKALNVKLQPHLMLRGTLHQLLPTTTGSYQLLLAIPSYYNLLPAAADYYQLLLATNYY